MASCLPHRVKHPDLGDIWTGGSATEFRLRGRDSVRFRGLVKITGPDGWVEVRTESKFGGNDTKRLTITVSGT